MNQLVIIKSYANGIVLHLNDEADFQHILQEIAVKFKESDHFFKDAKIALSLEGRVLSSQEELQVVHAISDNSHLQILCLIGKDEQKNQLLQNGLAQTTRLDQDNQGTFYRGTLKNGQCLTAEESLIILGDVYPGSTVSSKKDILIIGGLYGQAVAGQDGDDSHFICALEMNPQQLTIAMETYNPAKHKWAIKQKIQPKMAYVVQKQIQLVNLTREVTAMLDGSIKRH